LAGLRNFWQNTPCTVYHPAMACLTALELLTGEVIKIAR